MEINKENRYYYLYKITNNITGHFYYGIHTTTDLNDGYMGSGVRLHKAYELYGIENFTKEILEYFDNIDDMRNREREIVNHDLVVDEKCYNCCVGGSPIPFYNKFQALGPDGISLFIDKDSDEYKNGKFKSYWTDKVLCKDENNKGYWVSRDEFNNGKHKAIRKNVVTVIEKSTGIKKKIKCEDFDRKIYDYVIKDRITVKDENSKTGYRIISRDEWNTGKYDFMFKNTIIVKDPNTGKNKRVNLDDPDIDKYESIFKNKVLVKDTEGNRFWVDKNDPRWLSGELVGITKGVKLSEEHKEKLKKSSSKILKGKININNGENNKYIFPDELDKYIKLGWQKGRINKSEKRIYVNNGIKQIPIKESLLENFLKENTDYIKGGLKRGPSNRTYINKNGKNKHIKNEELEQYIKDGWKIGRIMRDQHNCTFIHNKKLGKNKFIDKKEAEIIIKNDSDWEYGMLRNKNKK